MTVNYSSDLLRNVHQNILLPEIGQSFLVKGDYEYWHYCCDGFNDKVCNGCHFVRLILYRKKRKKKDEMLNLGLGLWI